MMYSRHYGKTNKKILELREKQNDITREAAEKRKKAKTQAEKHKIDADKRKALEGVIKERHALGRKEESEIADKKLKNAVKPVVESPEIIDPSVSKEASEASELSVKKLEEALKGTSLDSVLDQILMLEEAKEKPRAGALKALKAKMEP